MTDLDNLFDDSTDEPDVVRILNKTTVFQCLIYLFFTGGNGPYPSKFEQAT